MQKNYNLIISANILPIVIEASQIAVNSKFVLRWHGTYCRMQIIGLGFVVKYTYMLKAKLQSVRTCRSQMPEDEAEDKISASRTVWPRGLNITIRFLIHSAQQISSVNSVWVSSYRPGRRQILTFWVETYFNVVLLLPLETRYPISAWFGIVTVWRSYIIRLRLSCFSVDLYI